MHITLTDSIRPDHVVYHDTYSQPDAPDPILNDDLVIELIQRHTSIGATTFEVDETGGEARAYVLRDVVLKTQRPQQLRPRTSLAKEAFILEQLAHRGFGKVPRILGYGREGDVEYEVLSRVPGIALRDATLSAAARTAVLHDVGATLRELHALDQDVLTRSGLIPGDETSHDVALRLRVHFDNAVEALERGGAVVKFDELRDEFLADLASEQPPVTLHSNPGSEHCFVDPDTGQFSGLIDFGDAYRSHPALDVRSWRSLEDSRLLLEGYAIEGELPEDFVRVWRAGLLVSQLRLAAHSNADETTLRRVIESVRNELGFAGK